LPIAAAMRAVYDTMKALREGMRPKDVPGIASPELMKRVTREAEYRRSIKDYLGGA
jgi:carboxyvinyl-carboxyphosphonate phosphorylmutase